MSKTYGGFCTKCVKGQRRAVKAQRARLVKAGIVTATKGAKGRSVVKAAPAPRRTVGALSWAESTAHDPAARETARAILGQALEERRLDAYATGRMLAKASGARSVRDAWRNESDSARRELLRAAMIASGEW